MVDKADPGSDRKAVVHNADYEEATQEEVMKLFVGKDLNKDYELLNEVNDGIFVLQTNIKNYWDIFWSDSAPYFHDRFI